MKTGVKVDRADKKDTQERKKEGIYWCGYSYVNEHFAMDVIRYKYSVINTKLTKMGHKLELFLGRYIKAVFVSWFQDRYFGTTITCEMLVKPNG